MNNYQQIVVGVDLSPESSQVLDRATQLSKLCQAEVHLVHVLEPLTFAYGGDIPMDLTEIQSQLQSQAEQHLHKLADHFNIGKPHCHLLVGQPAAELHRIAEEQSADLIIVGSHGRQGLALLLGSTANGVLHGANRDVLAVRVEEASA
ncbi:universal stress protein [Simiduia aestuariiviva]|uniref:Universal stress protein n=1 Tax=Simiduia aestuariiviva TaxID=1510459 RepID=A0A839URN9_9GAMM|nr:universal stress protein [Simiduia aestuariiviva]MBB3168526.1 universal stress protein A [Simiduia aestuariiviva]